MLRRSEREFINYFSTSVFLETHILLVWYLMMTLLETTRKDIMFFSFLRTVVICTLQLLWSSERGKKGKNIDNSNIHYSYSRFFFFCIVSTSIFLSKHIAVVGIESVITLITDVFI